MKNTLTLPQTWCQPSFSSRLHPERRRGSELRKRRKEKKVKKEKNNGWKEICLSSF